MWKTNFRVRRLQTFMMAVIILLCGLLMGASASILTSLDKPFRELAEECKAPHAVAYPYTEKEEEAEKLAKQLEKLEEVEEAVCVSRYYLNGAYSVNGEKLESFASLTEYNDKVFASSRYVEGSRETAIGLEEEECILPVCISNKYEIGIGDTLTIHTAEGKIDYKIAATYVTPYNVSTAYNSQILIKKFPENLTNTPQISVYCDENITMADIEKSYQKSYQMQFPGQFISQENAIENSLLASKILGAIILVIAVIMLLVSCLIINFMVRNAMIADAKTIAIYKTMGYETKDILNIYLMFYFVVSSAAAVTGIFLSKFFSEKVLQELYRDIGLQAEIKLGMIGPVCYLLMTGLILMTVFLVIQKTRKVKPIYALNGMSRTNTKKKYQQGHQKSFSPLGIAKGMAFRDKKGLAGILVTAVVSVVGMNFAVISLDVANNMKENNDYWLGLDRSDIMITLSKGVEMKEVQNLLKEEKKILNMIPGNINNIIALEQEGDRSSFIMEPLIYENFREADMDVAEGRNPENGKEIALSGKMSKETGKTIGDYIDLNLDGQKKSFLVTGLYQTYYNMGMACRLTAKAYDDISDFTYNILSVYLADGEDIEESIKVIEEKISGKGKVLPRTEQFSSIMEMISNPQITAIPPMTILVLFIGGANVFCIILLKNSKEEKTNSIYKCIGYSTGHLLAANLIYTGVLAAVTIAAAVPIILVCYPKIMKLALSTFELLEYNVSYDIWHLIIANSAIFAVFILCTMLSSRSLRKVDVRNLVCE